MIPLLTQALAMMLAVSGFLAAAGIEGMRLHHRPQATPKPAPQLGNKPVTVVAE